MSVLGVFGCLAVGCTDGSSGVPPAGGSGGKSESGTGGSSASGGSGEGSGGTTQSGGTTGSGSGGTSSGGTTGTGSGGTIASSGGAVGSGGETGSGGSAVASGGVVGSGGTAVASGGTAGPGGKGGAGTASGGTTGSGGASTGSGGASGGTARSGPFKILMLTTALEFAHDSIPTCTTLLQDLGKATAPERATIPGLAADSTWTVDPISSDTKSANYFSEVTADNLKAHELFYSNNPTGKVFTNAPSGATKKQLFVDYINNGGSWAGQHSASDFENNGSWSWFQDNIDGGWFTDHDDPTTNGSIKWTADGMNHAILKGLTSPWSTQDEWYVMNKDIASVKGFQVIANVTVSNTRFSGKETRPAVWIKENDKGGRSFYTIRGHSKSVYSEKEFRELMLRGILWAVHRLPGGD